MTYYTYDVIVLGAGINGCGIARELSLRSKKVLVIDKSIIGGGTSSKSSRLIHGGLRYLESFQFNLVKESLLDRKELTELYPDLVRFRPFYLPVYKSSPRNALIIWTGLKLYDFLSDKYTDHQSKIIPRKEFSLHAPCLKQENLRAVFKYYDAKTNDLKLTRQVAKDAENLGCTIVENTSVKQIKNNQSHFTISSNHGNFQAPVLINATGPWIDEVNHQYHLSAKYQIRKISGIHIVIHGLVANDLLFMQTKGKRIFFIIPEPELNQTLIGTTEREEVISPDDVIVNPEDVKYVLKNINEYLNTDHQIHASDIRHTFIGIRPLISHKENPTDLSREYELDLHKINGTKLLHVFGGKMTTFLSLARKAADLIR
ncbi:MAG: FAD-dependent oxidoreductase [Fidelibacterota bacterium]